MTDGMDTKPPATQGNNNNRHVVNNKASFRLWICCVDVKSPQLQHQSPSLRKFNTPPPPPPLSLSLSILKKKPPSNPLSDSFFHKKVPLNIASNPIKSQRPSPKNKPTRKPNPAPHNHAHASCSCSRKHCLCTPARFAPGLLGSCHDFLPLSRRWHC